MKYSLTYARVTKAIKAVVGFPFYIYKSYHLNNRIRDDVLKVAQFFDLHNINFAPKNVEQTVVLKTSFPVTKKRIQDSESFKNNSYAQCGEDRIIFFLLQLTDLKNNFTYLDIGANHPVNGNNTNLFYQMGFRGVLLEPNKNLINDIEISRPEDTVLNVGIGFKEETELLEFYVFQDHQLSTFSKTKADSLQKCGQELIETKQVELHNINKIIKEYLNGHVSFINLDAEGMDFQILQSLDFDNYKPDIICIENTDVNTSLDIDKKIEMAYEKKQSQKITGFMQEKGYFQYANNFVNSIYISKKLLKNFLEIVV